MNLFLIDILIHMWILWTLLTVLYFVYIGKKEQQVYRDEIEHIVLQSIRPYKGSLVGVRVNVPTKEDGLTSMINHRLLYFSITVSLMLLMVIILNLHQPGISKLIWENMALMTIVGTIEFFFFFYIILYYIPVGRSEIESAIAEAYSL